MTISSAGNPPQPSSLTSSTFLPSSSASYPLATTVSSVVSSPLIANSVLTDKKDLAQNNNLKVFLDQINLLNLLKKNMIINFV